MVSIQKNNFFATFIKKRDNGFILIETLLNITIGFIISTFVIYIP